jgi:TatD DNase family protein
MIELVDTHCHIHHAPLAESSAAVLARAAEAGVRHCLVVGTSAEDSRRAVELARAHPGTLRAAVGIHPNDAEAATEADIAAIDELAADPAVGAVGEIGLDRYRQHATPERQAWVLDRMLQIARRHQLPIAIHCRDAYEPLLEALRRAGPAGARGVIHCASGPADFIRGALALGLHVSFAGNVTFPKAEALRSLVPLVPDDRLLLETDAPWLAPQPVRGQVNEPAHVAHTAAALARIRGLSPEALGAATSRNARALFGFPVSDIKPALGDI